MELNIDGRKKPDRDEKYDHVAARSAIIRSAYQFATVHESCHSFSELRPRYSRTWRIGLRNCCIYRVTRACPACLSSITVIEFSSPKMVSATSFFIPVATSSSRFGPRDRELWPGDAAHVSAGDLNELSLRRLYLVLFHVWWGDAQLTCPHTRNYTDDTSFWTEITNDNNSV